jgi:hypothetical protein
MCLETKPEVCGKKVEKNYSREIEYRIQLIGKLRNYSLPTNWFFKRKIQMEKKYKIAP